MREITNPCSPPYVTCKTLLSQQHIRVYSKASLYQSKISQMYSDSIIFPYLHLGPQTPQSCRNDLRSLQLANLLRDLRTIMRPVFSSSFFLGRCLTYFSSWVYKQVIKLQKVLMINKKNRHHFILFNLPQTKYIWKFKIVFCKFYIFWIYVKIKSVTHSANTAYENRNLFEW